jgi:hypothetical protein
MTVECLAVRLALKMVAKKAVQMVVMTAEPMVGMSVVK